jgi:hypothetical protein
MKPLIFLSQELLSLVRVHRVSIALPCPPQSSKRIDSKMFLDSNTGNDTSYSLIVGGFRDATGKYARFLFESLRQLEMGIKE